MDYNGYIDNTDVGYHPQAIIMDDVISSGSINFSTDESDMWAGSNADYSAVSVESDMWAETIKNEELEQLKQDIKKLKEERMIGLYDVSAVDTKKGIVFDRFRVIAKDETRAKLKAAKLFGDEVDIGDDNTAIFVHLLGQWEDKKPKEVKIVNEK